MATSQTLSRRAEIIDVRRPFWDHLEDLRRHLLRALLWMGLGTAFAWRAAPRILEELVRPVGQVVYLSPAEPFLTLLKAAFLGGFVLSFPLLVLEASAFLRPAFSSAQRRALLALILISTGLFLLGAWFGWRFLLPAALTVLLRFGQGFMTPMLTVGNAVSFAGWMVVASGLAFQIPLAVWLAARLGWVRPAALLKQWRLAVVGILILAAALTPTPDVASQLIVAALMGALYLGSVGLAFLVRPR